MKSLLVIVLAALLGQDEAYIQANDKRIEKYRKVLEKSPDDPEACLQVGKHLCFVRADWDAGLPILSRAKDKALSEMAQYELGTMDLPSEKDSPLTGAIVTFGNAAAIDLIRGDVLWDISKKYHDVELRNIMNRAIFRYRLALSKVDAAARQRLLDRMSKVLERFRAMYTHPGRIVEGPMKGWGVVVGKGEKVEGIATDESRSHSGRSSMRVTPAKAGLLVTERRPIQPGEYTLSFWYLAEATVAKDPFQVWLFDKNDACERVQPPIQADRGDLPLWVKVDMKVKVGSEVLFFRMYIDNVGMRDGTLWIDDLSFKGGPKNEELAPNSGFEER